MLPSQLSVLFVDCQDTVKYRILGYFLNTDYRDEKCHTTQHYLLYVSYTLFLLYDGVNGK